MVCSECVEERNGGRVREEMYRGVAKQMVNISKVYNICLALDRRLNLSN